VVKTAKWKVIKKGARLLIALSTNGVISTSRFFGFRAQVETANYRTRLLEVPVTFGTVRHFLPLWW
jgi:hypothetical protein